MATRGQGGKFDPNLVLKRENRRSVDRSLQSRVQMMRQMRKGANKVRVGRGNVGRGNLE